MMVSLDSRDCKIHAFDGRPNIVGLQYLIDKLGTGDYGAADVAVDTQGRTCTKGTRVGHLHDIETWAVDSAPSGKPFRWVKGVAGSGKSTVVATIVKRLEAYNGLGAAFRFSRENPNRNKRVVPELARQLAYWNNGFLRSYIAEAVKTSSTVDHLTLEDQYEKLIRQPLQHLPSTAPPLVFILDALDEMDGPFAKELLDQIALDHATLPSYVKLIITSRVEPHLQASFESETLRGAVEHHALDADDAELKRKDIDLYFRDRLPQQVKLCNVKGKLKEWPGEARRAILVGMSQGLFIWAFIAALFIGDRDPEYQLALLIKSPAELTSLYALYAKVLQHSFPTGTVPAPTFELLRDVLGTLVVARTPLNIHSLGCLIYPEVVDRREIHRHICLHILAHLQSVLTVPGIDNPEPAEDEKPIQFLHKSFVDFLTTESSAPPSFFIEQTDHHARMVKACFLFMRGLKQNICELKDPSKLNSEVEGLQELVDTRISPSLQYACRCWSDHVAQARRQSTDILPLLKEFCQSRLLYWIEVLSLLGLAQDGIPMTDVILKWLQVKNTCLYSHILLSLMFGMVSAGPNQRYIRSNTHRHLAGYPPLPLRVHGTHRHQRDAHLSFRFTTCTGQNGPCVSR